MSTLTRTAFLRRLPPVARPAGVGAIVVKELRGRMRGRRAFLMITLHVLVLALFAAMVQRLAEQSVAVTSQFGGQATFASAAVGRGVFIGLMMVQTLMVAVLAPAATAGAISGEREHQTIDLLAVTPISSLAIVAGKLVSALAWLFVLILASVPVTALVFVFGGVAPDDVFRGYIVLIATAIGLGSVGLFFSAVTRRTGASTILTFAATLFIVGGSLFLWIFLERTGETNSQTGLRPRPPEAILYLNPFIAQADVACATEPGYGGTCSLVDGFIDSSVIVEPVPVPPIGPGIPRDFPAVEQGGGSDDGSGGKVVVIDGDVITRDVIFAATGQRDRFWPQSVASMLLLAAVLTVASVQFVSPTRRWRPSLPGRARLTPSRSDPGSRAEVTDLAPAAIDKVDQSTGAPDA
jgi:ABC-type transport system involved in multi-copper enzyme maturation permease subunit